MDLPIEALRFKEIRDSQQMTQAAFAKELQINSTTADIERGRTKIAGHIVMRLLKQFNINPLWLYGKSGQRFLNPNTRDVSPKMISVDQVGNENILLVSQKASAGYADNIGDPEYVLNLPAFSFPLPSFRNATFRGFQIEGDSMTPAVNSGDWIIAKAVSDLSEIKDGEIYIVVEKNGIRLKRLKKDLTKSILLLISLNPDYPTDQIGFDEVSEIWSFHSKLSFQLDGGLVNHKLETIHKDILHIKHALIQE